MFVKKKSIKLSRKEMNEIIVAMNLAATYMSENYNEISETSDNKELQAHYKRLTKKYKELTWKWIGKRDALFGKEKVLVDKDGNEIKR